MLTPGGAVEMEPVRRSLRDLWRMADAGGKPESVLAFEAMHAAKARRKP